MKKIIFAAGALMAIASCTQNEMESGALHEKQEMRFSSAQIATRVAGDAWEAEDEIGIYVMSNAQVINGNINYYTPAAATSASFLPNLDKGGVQIYYSEVETFDVFAYHPYDLEIEKSLYTINFASQDGSNPSPRQNYEVLEASKKDLMRDGKPIELEFTRVFSNIAVNLIAGIGFEESEIDKFWQLTLEDQITETTVSYTISDEELTLTNVPEKDDIKMTYYEYNPLFRDLVVASGVSFKPAFKLEFFESGVAKETLRLVSTEEITTTRGGQHIFNITVNRTPLGLVGEIAPWVDNDLDLESSDGTYYLADFASETLIPTHDEWVIMDTDEEAMKVNYYSTGSSNELDLSDFRHLYDAINKAIEKKPNREISLIFPNLETIPVYAFNQNISNEAAQIYGISAPSVTSVGENAFKDCEKLEKVDLSQVTSIAGYAFDGCTSLKILNIGYGETQSAEIVSISHDWLYDLDAETIKGITLSLGTIEGGMDDETTPTVEGDVLKWVNVEPPVWQTFKEIIQR